MGGISEQPVVIWNRDPSEAPEAPLLVLFHGIGSNEQDLMGLAPRLPQEFVVASVRAPLSYGQGFAWYPLYSDEAFDESSVLSAVEPLVAWVREQAQGRPATALLGFSQGMSMATSVARAMPGEIAAVIGLSGFTIPLELPVFRDDELRERPLKLFWGRDPQDPVILPELIEASAQWTVDHADVTKVQYQGMGHSVSEQEIRHVDEYLRSVVLGA